MSPPTRSNTGTAPGPNQGHERTQSPTTEQPEIRAHRIGPEGNADYRRTEAVTLTSGCRDAAATESNETKLPSP
jgi:hypothetical protein